MQFNKRLNLIRKRSKITQKSVSTYLGVTLRTYQRYEEGTIEPPLSTVSAIAKYFDIPVDCLLGNGLFANWEDILLHKDIILSSLVELLPAIPQILNLSDLSEKQLARLLPALLAKVTFTEDTISLYLLNSSEPEIPVEVPSGECQTDLPVHPSV